MRRKQTPLAFSSLLSDSADGFSIGTFFSVSRSTRSADLAMERAQQPLAPNTFQQQKESTQCSYSSDKYINIVTQGRLSVIDVCSFVNGVCEAAAASQTAPG